MLAPWYYIVCEKNTLKDLSKFRVNSMQKYLDELLLPLRLQIACLLLIFYIVIQWLFSKKKKVSIWIIN